MKYLFKSERLGFREWTDDDIPKLATINANPETMIFFPSTYNLEETTEFVRKMQRLFTDKGYCYFAVDLLEFNQFIGFIGICDKYFDADFTPCVDIGWRLTKEAWGNGLATEGAKRCLEYAFEVLNMEKIFAMAPSINIPSENVMKKIGMLKIKNFQHPILLNCPELRECVLYQISAS